MNVPKAVPVFFNGKPLKQVYPHATRWQVFKYNVMMAVRWVVLRVLLAGFVGSAMFGAYAYGAQGKEIKVVNSFVPVVQEVERKAAVMERIADCESGERLANGRAKKGSAKQFNPDGSVVIHENANGTSDVGYYQINMIAAHLKNMARLGLNPLTEEGNKAYGEWLYENQGTGPWASSQSCWL